MQTKEVESAHGFTVKRGVETVKAGDKHVGPTIEHYEKEGWQFVDSRSKHGFVHLYFTRFVE